MGSLNERTYMISIENLYFRETKVAVVIVMNEIYFQSVLFTKYNLNME
jgi:hypothetical protein